MTSQSNYCVNLCKGKGTRTKVNAPNGMEYHWAPKGFYKLKDILKTISPLSNRYNMCIPNI